MVTGASTAELAVILIDARKGVLNQTRRHSYLCFLLGIKNFVLAVNKMDLVKYDQAIFNAIVKEYKNKILKPKRYTHLWKTKKQTKKMSLIFDNNKVKSIKQTPDEKEYLRINVFSEEKTKDPLSSFLQIIMGMKSSLVIDGRRLYTMSAVSPNGANKTIIQLINYSNLWADHKRSKFEKIVFEKNSKDFLPSKIFIYFDKRVFRLQ